MKQLKTLKDIEQEWKDDITEKAKSGDFLINTTLVGANLGILKELKKLAIKWVKENFDMNLSILPNLKKITTCFDEKDKKFDVRANKAIQIWLRFFNITEEDLK